MLILSRSALFIEFKNGTKHKKQNSAANDPVLRPYALFIQRNWQAFGLEGSNHEWNLEI